MAEIRAKGEAPSEFLKWTELRYGYLEEFKNAKIPTWSEESMTPDLLQEWWNIVSPGEFQLQALTALKTMWEGAPKMLSDEARKGVVPWGIASSGL
jgi:hypothetical protein